MIYYYQSLCLCIEFINIQVILQERSWNNLVQIIVGLKFSKHLFFTLFTSDIGFII